MKKIRALIRFFFTIVPLFVLRGIDWIVFENYEVVNFTVTIDHFREDKEKKAFVESLNEKF